MADWTIVKQIVGSEHLGQIRESELQAYYEQLETGYRADFEGFKDHLKRFVKLAVREHYERLENPRPQRDEPGIQEKKGLEKLIFWKKPQSNQPEPVQVDWASVDTRLSDDNVFSNDTVSIALSHIQDDYNAAYRIVQMIPFKLGSITEEKDSSSISLADSYSGDIMQTFLKNLQVTDLESLAEDYVKVRGSKKCLGYGYEKKAKRAVEGNVQRKVLEELAGQEDLSPALQGSKVYLSFHNKGLDFRVGYDASTGRMEIDVEGQTDVESARTYFGNLKGDSGCSSSYAGRSFNFGYNDEFGSFDLERAKARIETAIAKYESEESPDSTLERFNLSDEHTGLMEGKLQPLYDKLNETQNAIRQAESEFVQHSTPKFDFTLVKKGDVLGRADDFIAQVKLSYDGNQVSVNGNYTKVNPEKIGMLDCLFS